MKNTKQYIQAFVMAALMKLGMTSCATQQYQTNDRKSAKSEKVVSGRVTGLIYDETTDEDSYDQVAVELRQGGKTFILDKTINGTVLDRNLPDEYALGEKIKFVKDAQLQENDTVRADKVLPTKLTKTARVVGLAYDEASGTAFGQVAVELRVGGKKVILDKTIDGINLDYRLPDEYALGEKIELRKNESLRNNDTIKADQVAGIAYTISGRVVGLIYDETHGEDSFEQVAVAVNCSGKEIILEKTLKGTKILDNRLPDEYALGDKIKLRMSAKDVKRCDTITPNQVILSQQKAR